MAQDIQNNNNNNNKRKHGKGAESEKPLERGRVTPLLPHTGGQHRQASCWEGTSKAHQCYFVSELEVTALHLCVYEYQMYSHSCHCLERQKVTTCWTSGLFLWCKYVFFKDLFKNILLHFTQPWLTKVVMFFDIRKCIRPKDGYHVCKMLLLHLEVNI